MMMAQAATARQISSPSFSTDDFTAGLLAGFAKQGKSRVPIGHPEIESSFRAIVSFLQQEAVAAAGEGREEFAFQLLDVLERLRPDPNSGLLDGFWSAIRRQQPGRASVPNPSYDFLQIRMTPRDAAKYLNSVPEDWRSIIDRSVEILTRDD